MNPTLPQSGSASERALTAAVMRRPPWRKLGERTKRMLQRVNDCVLLRESDLSQLVWPEGSSRQAKEERLKIWVQDGFLQLVRLDGHERAYQLGPFGARLLREAGFPRIASTRVLADRIRPGILAANQFGVSLADDIRSDLAVAGMAWVVRPFSGGDETRGDAIAAIVYDEWGLPAPRTEPDAYLPACLDTHYVPPDGMAVMRLIIEIDHGSEDPHQLARRAVNWRARWEQIPWPPRTTGMVLWITTKGFSRLETIWHAWIRHAMIPAWFTTTATLGYGDPHHWHPWHPVRTTADGRQLMVWHDLNGRPRSLRPWDGHEIQFRHEPPPPITAHSLADAIRAAYQVSPSFRTEPQLEPPAGQAAVSQPSQPSPAAPPPSPPPSAPLAVRAESERTDAPGATAPSGTTGLPSALRSARLAPPLPDHPPAPTPSV